MEKVKQVVDQKLQLMGEMHEMRAQDIEKRRAFNVALEKSAADLRMFAAFSQTASILRFSSSVFMRFSVFTKHVS